MSTKASAISASELSARIGLPDAPVVFDVCRAEAFSNCERVIVGARWRDHLLADQWGRALDPGQEVVVSCLHGHNVSQIAAAKLRAIGLKARFLEGGTEGYLGQGGLSVLRRPDPHDLGEEPSRWVTREKPKIDRIACPWFIRRFLDPRAEIIYVETEWVRDVAEELHAVPFDIEGVDFSHEGELCSFDTFLDRFGVDDPSLRHLARIIRGADTARMELEPQCAGLMALSLGVSALYDDDLAALAHGMAIYDALYAWVRKARDERHDWTGKSAAA